MNQILLFNDDFISEKIVKLTGRRAVHINEVINKEPGAILKAGLVDSKMGIAKIMQRSQNQVVLDVELNELPPCPLTMNLVVAIPRPKVLRRLVQCAISMGVKKIYFIRTWRVDKSYLESPVLSTESLFDDAVLGLEQCRDTIMPQISVHKLFRPFVEDLLPQISNEGIRIVAHPYSEKSMPSDIEKPSTVVIGPEGGFVDYEIKLLREGGFEAFTLGKRIMRVENVVPAIIGRLYNI